MARGDVISDWELSQTTGTVTSLQPASGDEWMITLIGNNNGTAGQLRLYLQTTADIIYGNNSGVGSSELPVSQVQFLLGTAASAKVFASNTDYPRLHNGSPSTKVASYSAIKTKD
jgi:hypothetical protein